MELFISIVANIVLLFILIARSGKSSSTEVEEKIVYVPEIRYRDRIEYKDRVIYQDRIVYQDKVVKEYVPSSGQVVVNNNFNTSDNRKVKKNVPKKVKTTKVTEPKTVKVEEPKKETVSSKRAEILKELEILRSKKKKSKQDLETIYTLEAVLPNIK